MAGEFGPPSVKVPVTLGVPDDLGQRRKRGVPGNYAKTAENTGKTPEAGRLPSRPRVSTRVAGWFAGNQKAPRPGLEPGTNRLTGAKKYPPSRLLNPYYNKSYVITASFASVCVGFPRLAKNRGNSAVREGMRGIARKNCGRIIGAETIAPGDGARRKGGAPRPRPVSSQSSSAVSQAGQLARTR